MLLYRVAQVFCNPENKRQKKYFIRKLDNTKLQQLTVENDLLVQYATSQLKGGDFGKLIVRFDP